MAGIKSYPYTMKPRNRLHMEEFMRRMIMEGVIRPINKHEVMAYMPTFQIPKKNGFRVITDCRKLNEFISTTSFKGQSAYTVIRKMQDFPYIAKLDLKDAYYHIKLGNNIQKHLAFIYKGKSYTWTRLIQGIADGPTIFQQFLADTLDEFKPNVMNYLDDIAIGANTEKELKDI